MPKARDTGHDAYLLGLTAAGLFCDAAYCLVDARYRDASTNAMTQRPPQRRRSIRRGGS